MCIRDSSRRLCLSEKCKQSEVLSVVPQINVFKVLKYYNQTLYTLEVQQLDNTKYKVSVECETPATCFVQEY